MSDMHPLIKELRDLRNDGASDKELSDKAIEIVEKVLFPGVDEAERANELLGEDERLKQFHKNCDDFADVFEDIEDGRGKQVFDSFHEYMEKSFGKSKKVASSASGHGLPTQEDCDFVQGPCSCGAWH